MRPRMLVDIDTYAKTNQRLDAVDSALDAFCAAWVAYRHIDATWRADRVRAIDPTTTLPGAADGAVITWADLKHAMRNVISGHSLGHRTFKLRPAKKETPNE